MFADDQSDSKSPGSYRIWLESGIIHQKLGGTQTAETVAGITRETDQFVEQLQAKHEPVLILSDFTDVRDQTQAARNGLKDTLGNRYFDRIAAFGVSPSLRVVGELMLSIIGKKDRIQIFDSREQAMLWLQEFAYREQH